MTAERTAVEELIAAIVASDRGGSRLPESVVGVDLDVHEGAAVQVQVLARHIAAGDSLAGWKVGMTSGESHNAMGQGVRPFGSIRGSRAYSSGGAAAVESIPGPGIEIELGLEVASAIGGAAVSRDEVRAAIAGWAPCFEIIQGRVPPATAGVRVAAGLSQWGLVTGTFGELTAPVSDLVATLECDGQVVAGAGPEFDIDDPIDSVRALCASLAPFGIGLLPGQHVITGAFVKQPVLGPGRWRGILSGLGEVEFTFG